MGKVKNNELDRKVVSGVSWKIAERVLVQGISFFVTIILARILTPNDYGLVAIVNIFVAIADIIITSGFTAALIQKQNASNDDYNTIFYLNLMLSVGLYALLFFLAPTISGMYKNDSLTWILRIISLKLPLSALYSVQSAYVSRNMQFKLFFFSTLFGTLISAVVGVIMANQGYGAWALVAQQLISVAINSIVLAITIKWRPGLSFKKSTIKETYNFGTKIMATDFIASTFNQLSAFIVGLFYSAEDLAYYSKGQNLPNMVTTITATSFTSVMFPAMASVANDRKKVKSLLISSTKMISFILFPILCGMLIVSNELVEILYTTKWNGVIIFLQIMCAASIISIIGEFDIITLKSIGKGGLILKLEFIKKPIFIIMTLVAVQFGVVWIALSYVFVSLIATIINTFALKKNIGYGLLQKILDCLPAILMSLVMIVSVLLVDLLHINSVYLNIGLKVFVGVVVYIGLAILTKNKQMKAIIKFFKNKLKKNKDDIQEERALFVCNSVNQIVCAAAIASSRNLKADIIISAQSEKIQKIVKKMQKDNKLFANCNFIQTKEFCFGTTEDKNKLKNQLFIELKEKGYIQKYDIFFCSDWEPFVYMLYKSLKKVNDNIELSWFENDIEENNFNIQCFEKPTFKTSIKNFVKRELSLYEEIDSFNLFKPEQLNLSLDKEIVINQIPEINDETQEYLNKILDYEKLKNKNS